MFRYLLSHLHKGFLVFNWFFEVNTYYCSSLQDFKALCLSYLYGMGFQKGRYLLQKFKIKFDFKVLHAQLIDVAFRSRSWQVGKRHFDVLPIVPEKQFEYRVSSTGQVKKVIKKYFVHSSIFQASSNKLSVKPSCITQLSKINKKNNAGTTILLNFGLGPKRGSP